MILYSASKIMQFLNIDKLKLPLFETANLTFWNPCSDEDQISDFQQIQDVPFLNDSEVINCFNVNRVYGLVGVLARDFVPHFYLIIVPSCLSAAKLFFVPKSSVTANLNKNVNDRNPLFGANFYKQGQFRTSTLIYDLFLTRCHDNFSGMKLFRKQKDYVSAESFWDSFVFDKPMVEVLSKKKIAREVLKRKQNKIEFFDELSENFNAKNIRLEMEPRPQSHVLPNDIINLLNAEKLSTNEKVPVRNSIKSRDSGGLNPVVSAIQHQQPDNAKIYLSDYHVASEVPNAYSTVHNQTSLLAAKEKLEQFLIINGHEKGSKTFDKAVGAVSDKFFEGIEHRMEAEVPLPFKFTDIKLDIDQV
jgi:hypothetical protein